MNILKNSLMNDLMREWKTKKQAEGIAQHSLRKNGLINDQDKLTRLWVVRSRMSKEERAITRETRKSKRPAYHYKVVNGKPIIKNIYKNKK